MLRNLFMLTMGALVALPANTRADIFDDYINPTLAKAVTRNEVREVKRLTPDIITSNDRVLKGISGAILVVKTNGNRYSKLLVMAGWRKIKEAKTIPLLLIERCVTYQEAKEQAIQARASNVHLFPDFRFSLDLGQIVPEALGGDLRLVEKEDAIFIEPLDKAKLYILIKPLPEASALRQSDKLIMGPHFEPRYFQGSYRLFDDGRRSGKLTLKVLHNGDIEGAYYSDKDGQRYEVYGKIGMPQHSIQFTIKFPRSDQMFRGWLFTGDGKALTGFSKLQDREAGFYALREE